MSKILFIITKSEVGGAQKWVRDQICLIGDAVDCFVSVNKPGWLTKKICKRKILFDKRIEKSGWLSKIPKENKEQRPKLIIIGPRMPLGPGKAHSYQQRPLLACLPRRVATSTTVLRCSCRPLRWITMLLAAMTSASPARTTCLPSPR